MRKIFLYILIASGLAGSSCKKFLDEYSQDMIRPNNIIDLSSVMYSDAYPGQLAIDNLDLLTDDIICNGVARSNTGDPIPAYATSLQNGMAIFKFDPNMFEPVSTIPAEANIYKICYDKIKGCNVVMDYIPKITGNDGDKNALLGQCLFLRSYYYMRLLNAYAQPYTKPGQDPATALGVPLVLSSQVKDGGLRRNTLKEVYDQLEKDLLSAAALLKDNYATPNAFRAGFVAAYTLLSRLYLYKGDWDKTIEYSSLALQENSNLLKLTTFINNTNNILNAGLYNTGNSEIIWLYGGNNPLSGIYYPTPVSGGLPPFMASPDLISLYERGDGTNNNYGDLRLLTYISSSGGTFYYSAKNTPNGVYGTRGLRVAELYLNRAEASIRRAMDNSNSADIAQALSDLNTLRESRYDTRQKAYTQVVINDPATLYTFCQTERRKEFCLEDAHRWADIKRWGVSVTHNFTSLDGAASVYVLEANSKMYALPIPYTAIANNSDLQQNPR